MPTPVFRRLALCILLLPPLAGCERMAAQLGLPDPAKEAAAAEAEGRAIGSACRHSGRALEDCYALNPAAAKASVFAGWREMNDYMTQNNLAVVPSRLPTASLTLPSPKADSPKTEEHADASHATPAEDPPAAETRPRRRLRRSGEAAS